MEEQGVEETKTVLNKYRNCKDSDIQDFLNNKALVFEERKWCNTYLIVDEDTLACQKEIKVELPARHAMKSTFIGRSHSQTKNKKNWTIIIVKQRHEERKTLISVIFFTISMKNCSGLQGNSSVFATPFLKQP